MGESPLGSYYEEASLQSRSTEPNAVTDEEYIALPHERVSIFVSSTIGELQNERKVARQIIGDELNLYPVVFESGARPHPPRQLYRTSLSRSHIVVAIYWESYGWIAPDMDISGIHDELKLAHELIKPLLVYLKRTTKRDARLQEMISLVANEVTYVEFDTLEEFGKLLKQDLQRLLSERFLFNSPQQTNQAEHRLVVPELLEGLQEDMHRRGMLPRPDVIGELRNRLQEVQRLLIVGPPGAGKTYLLGALGKELEGTYVSLSNQTTQQVCQYLANRLRILRGETPQSHASEGDARSALQAELAVSEHDLLTDHADQNIETTKALLSLTTFRCRLIFASRASDPVLFGDTSTYEVPPFTRDEVEEFLTLKEVTLPPGQLEQLRLASAGSPMYLYFFATERVSPLPKGLHAYQKALYERLSAASQHMLNLVATSLTPLQIADLHSLLSKDDTINGPPTQTRKLVTSLGALVRSIQGYFEVFHPHFQEFILDAIEQDGLTGDYNQQLADLAINKKHPYSAAYHLLQANDPRARDHLLEGALIARLHGRWNHAETFARRLLDFATEDNDTELLIESRTLLSETLSHMGRYEEARHMIREAIEIAKEHNATEHLDSLELWSGTLLVDENRPKEAIDLLNEMLSKHADEDSFFRAAILFNLSFAYLRTYQWQQGASAAELAHTIFTELGMAGDAHRCLINLCGCLVEIGKEARAMRLGQQLLEYARRHNLPREEAAALNVLVRTNRKAGNFIEAEAYARETLALWQRLGVIEKQAMSLNNLGNTLRDQKRYAEAEAAYLEAMQLATENKLPRGHAFALERLSDLRLAEERFPQAIEFGEQALMLHRESGDILRVANTLEISGSAHKQVKNYPNALAAYEEAGTSYTQVELWKDATNAFEEAAIVSKVVDDARVPDFVERAIQAALFDRDGNRVVELLQLGQPENGKPPYLEALDRLLGTMPQPRLGLFLTNLVSYVKSLPNADRDRLLSQVIETMLGHVLQTAEKWPLGAIGAMLVITGDAVPNCVVEIICKRVQEIEGIYYRTYPDGRSLWTIGLAWERPLILQFEASTDQTYFQRLSLALTLYIAANESRFESGIKGFGGNQAGELLFVLCSNSDFETYVSKGNGKAPPPTPEHPATFAGFAKAADPAEQWSQMWVISVDDLQTLSDVTDGVIAPAVRLVIGKLTMHLVQRCTGIAEEREDLVGLVADIFKNTFF